MAIDISHLLQLPAEEKLQIIGELWDSLDASAEQLPIPDSHFDELDRRRERYQMNPETASTWEEVEERIKRRNG
jgi:putative addiction module component (TIGR02574 family)